MVYEVSGAAAEVVSRVRSSSPGRQSCVPTEYGARDAAGSALGHRPSGISRVKRLRAKPRIARGVPLDDSPDQSLR
jgi:hypothetical protein